MQGFTNFDGHAFPEPSRDDETGRPFYDEEQQVVCLEVRRRNCGVDGKPILFYARRGGAESDEWQPSKAKAKGQERCCTQTHRRCRSVRSV